MKKIIIAALSAFVLLGCSGGSSGGGTSGGGSSTSSQTSTKDNEIIELGDIVLLDNEYVTVKAQSFYKTHYANSDPATVAFFVTNKLDRDITFDFFNPNQYLGDIQVKVSYGQGNTITAGKSAEFSIFVSKVKNGEDVDIEDLKELYDLNGEIEIKVFTADGKHFESDRERDFKYDLSTLK